jgi:HPt (histidine-containing phosphotransfer) domain-containing protein
MAVDDEIDPSAIERLERLGGRSFVARVVGAFLRDAPQKVARARAALESQDVEALAASGHGLISGAGNLGANGVSELSRNIERAAHGGHWDILPGMVTRLETAFASVQTRLTEYVDEARSSK